MIQPNTKYARILLKSGPITVTGGGGSWATLTGKPALFPPEPHNHTVADVIGLGNITGNLTTIQNDIATLRAVDNQLQNDAATLAADIAAITLNATVPHTHVTGDVVGLDGWMATTDNAVNSVRANLTGKSPIGHTHPSSEITDFVTQLQIKADKVHVHEIAQINGLTAALANTTAGKHTHTQADVTGLVACLTGLATDLNTLSASNALKTPLTRYATTAAPGLVKVGHNLSVTSDGTLSASAGADWANITGKPTTFAPAPHNHTTGDVAGLATTLANTAGRIATIEAQLPSFADKTHRHDIADVSGLAAQIGAFTACFTTTDAKLALKVNEGIADARYSHVGHTHYITDVTGLQPELDALKRIAGSSSYTLPPATLFTLGGIKIGRNLNVALDGTLDATGGYTLPVATTASVGGVRPGSTIMVQTDGTMDVNPALLVTAAQRGAPNGVATLDGSGKIPSSQMNAIAISNTFVVGNQAERLTVPGANPGDIAVQLDISQTFILQKLPATDNGSWVRLLNNTACVTSVNNMTGNVELFGRNIKENVYSINGLTGNVTLEGTNIANNVWSFNGRSGNITLMAADLPVASLGQVGAMRPDGNTTFANSNGVLSAIVAYTKAEVDAKLDQVVTGISHGVSVIDIVNTPPTTPVIDTFYIVGTAPTGVFLAHENELAVWNGTAWKFATAINGETHLVDSQKANYSWNGTKWVKIASGSTAAAEAGDLWIVGDIKQSTLTEAQFKTAIGPSQESKWALADGRDVSTSEYARITGRTTIPDLRGAFLRMTGQNANPNWIGGPLNDFQWDSTKLPNTAFTGTTSTTGSHTHSWGIGSTQSKGGGDYEIVNGWDRPRTTGAAGDHSHTVTINGGGDTETRPKNYGVNFFIKIN